MGAVNAAFLAAGPTLQTLSTIRNVVMHPRRGTRPSKEDLGFVWGFRHDLEIELADRRGFRH